jgi:hypothetical protein
MLYPSRNTKTNNLPLGCSNEKDTNTILLIKMAYCTCAKYPFADEDYIDPLSLQ